MSELKNISKETLNKVNFLLPKLRERKGISYLSTIVLEDMRERVYTGEKLTIHDEEYVESLWSLYGDI